MLARAAVAVALLLLCLPAPLRAQVTVDARVVSAEADQLLADATRTRFGIGWNAAKAGEPISVSFAPDQTPAAALYLWRAGQSLHVERYSQAAIDVALTIVRAQEPGGKVADTATFGSAGVVRQERFQQVPSRRSTCASLALLLTIIRESPHPEPRLVSAARRASTWLSSQLTPHGVWPTLFYDTIDLKDTFNLPRKVVRLDQPDFRDSTLCLLLAAPQFDDAGLKHRAQMAIGSLLAMQLDNDAALGVGDWCPAYTLGQLPLKNADAIRYAMDTGATDLSLQTLLAEAVFTNDPALLHPIHVATRSLLAIRRTDGRWDRQYPLIAPHLGDPAPLVPRKPSLFASPTTADCPPTLVETVNLIESMDRAGLAVFAAQLQARQPLEREIALTIAGLTPAVFQTGDASGSGVGDAGKGSGLTPGRLQRLWEHLAMVESPENR